VICRPTQPNASSAFSAAVLSAAFKHTAPHITPWIATTCEKLADEVPDELAQAEETRKRWKVARAEDVVFSAKSMPDTHTEAVLLWRALDSYFLHVELVRVLFFDPKDRLLIA
jgi:hypothetical protein